MASSSNAIINPLFCVPYPIDLAFTTKPPGDKKSGKLTAIDAAGNVLFKAKDSSSGGFTQLQDAAGHTILTMKAKFRTLHERWQAFRGDSTEAKDLIFSIKKSSAFQIHDEWFVYLARNTKEENCDFKIKGSYSKKNYTIYKGDSSFVVAQFWSPQDRWQVFRGDSTKKEDLLFSMKRSFMLNEWVVHLSGNAKEKNCDFKIIGSYRQKNYKIYKGDSSFVVAQITDKHGMNFSPKNAFGAIISANCDYSFVAALITMFHVIYGSDDDDDDDGNGACVDGSKIFDLILSILDAAGS